MENEQGCLRCINGDSRCLQVFAAELEPLTDRYRRFVADSFGMICPEYFWHVTAALGGRNHPWACRSVGGLVKHTKLAVWWAHRLIHFRGDVLDEQAQEIIAALLLHDICKFEKPDGVTGVNTVGKAVKCHGHWAARALYTAWDIPPASNWMSRRFPKMVGAISGKSFERITNAVAWHMGQWSQGAPVNRSQWDMFGGVVYDVVSMADYLAASKVDAAIAQLQHTGSIEYEDTLNFSRDKGGEA